MLRTLKRNLRQTVAGLLNRLKSVTFETAVGCNLLQLRFFSFVTGAPIGLTDEEVFVHESLWKRVLWIASLGILCLRAVFMAGAVTLSVTVDRFWNPFFLPLYLGVLAACCASLSIGYSVLSCEPGCFATTWNFVLKHKSTAKSPKLLVWVMCVLAPSGYVCSLGICFLLALNPQLAIQFRFGVELALEEGLLTAGPTYKMLVAISTVADFWSFFVMASAICIFGISQMLCLEAWTSVMNRFLASCKRSISTIKADPVWRRLKELVVFIRVFNTCNSSAIFILKLTCLAMSVSSSTAVLILNFDGNSLFLVIMLYLSIAITIGFPIVYHRAYGVSAGLERAKHELLKFRQLDRRLGAISTKGLQVGSFRTFERESDLIYLDFIVRTVTSIVLAWN